MTIEGFVTDSETDAPISGVLVEVITGEKIISSTSDNNGGFKLEGLLAGTYTVKFSKDGYLSTTKSYEYLPEVVIENYSLHSKVHIAPLNDKLNMNVYKSVHGVPTAAANQSYEINLGDGQIINGTTDENGFLHVDNVPYAGYYFLIKFEFTDNGILYRLSDVITSLTTSTIIYGNAIGDLGLVSSNVIDNRGWAVNDFPIDGSMTFTFTQPIDVEDVDIYFGYYYNNYSIGWSNNNKTLTITPSTSLYNDNNYYVHIQVYNDTRTDYYENYFSFKTVEL
ncbi:MAG: hypothetical protein HC831_10825 [Chloroflexia bacterium]|nr:hypothetical protein [Chloroflexia bacterium]